VDLVTWLHIPPFGTDFEAQHRAYLAYGWRDRDRFMVMRNETEYHPIDRRTARVHNWACALVGVHALEAQLNAARADRRDRIVDAGHVVAFMEQTDWYTMRPADELAAESGKWCLANPGQSYIVYSYECGEKIGLATLPRGEYALLWFDAVSGKEVRQTVTQAADSPAVCAKPAGFSREVAVYIRRLP
jgi:hypothetical protein